MAGLLLAATMPGTVGAARSEVPGEPGSCNAFQVPIIGSNGQVLCLPRCPSWALPILLGTTVYCVPIASPTFPDPGPIA